MAKIAKKLTDTEIKSTKPTDKEINLFDGDGLILRIAPLAKGGKKNWYFRYAVPVSKKRIKMSLGTYPHLTLARARALRDEYLSFLANGVDLRVWSDASSPVVAQKCRYDRAGLSVQNCLSGL